MTKVKVFRYKASGDLKDEIEKWFSKNSNIKVTSNNSLWNGTNHVVIITYESVSGDKDKL